MWRRFESSESSLANEHYAVGIIRLNREIREVSDNNFPRPSAIRLSKYQRCFIYAASPGARVTFWTTFPPFKIDVSGARSLDCDRYTS